jgi:hypothetical protein
MCCAGFLRSGRGSENKSNMLLVGANTIPFSASDDENDDDFRPGRPVATSAVQGCLAIAGRRGYLGGSIQCSTPAGRSYARF